MQLFLQRCQGRLISKWLKVLRLRFGACSLSFGFRVYGLGFGFWGLGFSVARFSVSFRFIALGFGMREVPRNSDTGALGNATMKAGDPLCKDP